MTEKDINSMRMMITDLLATHTEKIEGKFNVIAVELLAIKVQTTKTNGRVNRHDEEFKLISKAEDMHVINCPHNKPVADFVAIRRYWKPIVAGLAVMGCLAVVGAYVTVDNFHQLFQKDIVIEKRVDDNTEGVIDTKEDVSNIKDAVNKQGVTNAYEYGKNEK